MPFPGASLGCGARTALILMPYSAQLALAMLLNPES